MSDEPHTVRVRIAVAVWPDGEWVAHGRHGYSDNDGRMKIFAETGDCEYLIQYVEADVPVPQGAEIGIGDRVKVPGCTGTYTVTEIVPSWNGELIARFKEGGFWRCSRLKVTDAA